MLATNVYDRIRQAIKQEYRIIVLQGGARSSKTYSTVQNLLNLALETEKSDLQITIARKQLSWVKTTVLNDFKLITDQYREELGEVLTPPVNVRRQEQIYNFAGVEFGFFGLDDPDKLRGRKQHVTWLNEVTEIDKESFEQLEMRTTGFMILDFNPSDEDHWVFDLKSRDDVIFLYSDVSDNPFIEESIRRKIKSYEPTPENIARKTADLWRWQVYGLGIPAKLEGLIYPTWEECESIPEGARFRGIGLDFGFRTDPCACVELYTYNNSIYINELFYERGMLNSDIHNKLKELIDINCLIIADSSEPKSIEELRLLGCRGIRGVKKGADSINFGIKIVQQFPIFITRKSVNTIAEIKKYKLAQDRLGKNLDYPVDKDNHSMDAMRYIVMETLASRDEIKIYGRNAFA